MFKIITTSSLIPRNGIDTLILACALLPETLDWNLTIAGSGPMQNELEKLCVNKKIMAHVKFLGRVPNIQVPNLLVSCDLFVRPSRFEGFGSSFIEAMAAGIPVIGTPVGGIIDFIKNGETGLLVNPDNPDKLAVAIIKLQKDKKLYATLQQNGLKLVKEKYDWDIIADKVFKEMEKLCR